MTDRDAMHKQRYAQATNMLHEKNKLLQARLKLILMHVDMLEDMLNDYEGHLEALDEDTKKPPEEEAGKVMVDMES
jgi:hypothetical protein